MQQMTSKPPVVRSMPKTQGGEEIYDAILGATAQLISEEGIQSLTSNRIAAVAGVSIGSFYRYLGNKEAAVAELFRRREREAAELVIEHIKSLGPEASFRDKARVTVELVIMGGTTGPQVEVRRLHQAVPPEWLEPASHAADDAIRGFVKLLLLDIPSLAKRDDLDVLAFIMVHAVEKVVETAVIQKPELLGTPAFTEELIELLVRFVDR